MATSPTGLPDGSTTPALRLRSTLVGREHELALLDDALFDALTTRTPHAVVLMGAAGVGKSRLCREFLADVRVRHPELRVLAAQCREGGERYGAIRTILRSRLGVVDGMSPDEAQNTVRAAVGEAMGDRRVGELVHFLSAFLDLELPESELVQAMSDDPDQMRQIGRSALRRFLEADANKQPVVLVLDDFQLAHPDAASLVHYLIGSITSAPLLFMIVARPELFDRHPEWLDLGGESLRFDLAPLGEDHAVEMLEQLLAPLADFPEERAELIDESIELAGGNPFLLEQIVRTCVEQGVIRTGERWSADLSRLEQVQLPLSVDDAIAARIATLSPGERALLEMAASMGGVFWLGALIALERAASAAPALWSDPDQDRKRIATMLEQLIERDYVLRLPDASIAGETEYAFKHNLEREALHRYTSRQLLSRHHRVIAQWLELHLGDSSEEQHELLAQHYDLGGVAARAAHHYASAGERARLRHAHARAAEYYRRALALLGEGEGLTRLRTLKHFGDALDRSGQRDHALAVFEQMRGLAFQLDQPRAGASAHARIGSIHRDLAHLGDAQAHLDAAQALYEATGDQRGAARVLSALAGVHVFRGNLSAAEHMFREAIATFEELNDERALLGALIGDAAVARERFQLPVAEDALSRALGLARKLGDEASAADVLVQLGVVRDRMRQQGAAIAHWNEALEIAKRTSDRPRQASALSCLGASAYRAGAYAEALVHLTQAASLVSALGNRLIEADVLRSLAKARAQNGDLAAGIADANRAVELFEAAQTKPQLGVALRTLGELSGSDPGRPPEEAISALERACTLFGEVGNDYELARASLVLAEQLGRGSGEAADGRDRAIRAEALRARARVLLDGSVDITMRASRS